MTTIKRTPFQYLVIRFTADVITDEFVNVGVAVLAPEMPWFGARVLSKYERLTNFFPDFDGDQYRRMATHLQLEMDSMSDKISGASTLFPEHPADLSVLVNGVIPPADAAFKAGAVVHGLTEEPARQLDRLFARLVERHLPQPNSEGRDEAEVWQTFKQPLQELRVLEKLTPVTLNTRYESNITISRSWRNGTLNVMQPVSLDLKQPYSILRKAKTWMGDLETYKTAEEPPHVHLLVGKPTRPEEALQRAYANAVRMLLDYSAELNLDVVEETDAPEFAKRVSDELLQHTDP